MKIDKTTLRLSKRAQALGEGYVYVTGKEPLYIPSAEIQKSGWCDPRAREIYMLFAPIFKFVIKRKKYLWLHHVLHKPLLAITVHF